MWALAAEAVGEPLRPWCQAFLAFVVGFCLAARSMGRFGVAVCSRNTLRFTKGSSILVAGVKSTNSYKLDQRMSVIVSA